MNALLWVVVLFLLGLCVMVLEVFLPSGGILGFLSLTAIIAAIATAFLEQGVAAGMAALTVAAVVVPTVLALAFRWFPETPLGRRVLPPLPDPAEMLPNAPGRRRLQELVGGTGRAVTEMLPWGIVEIGGIRVESVSESGPITPDTAVDVVGVQGRALTVVSALPRETAAPARPRQPLPPAQEAATGDSRLSPTLEDFEFERLDPPSA